MTTRGASPGKPSAGRAPVRGPDDLTVVGIGASAGGLEASMTLVGALPAHTGMAFILVQHLDPTHESMMVDLLSGHTSMTVVQASDGMRLAREHFYVIPPGTYLSVADGALHLSPPQARHGARLPFDFLLHSLAKACGSRAVCVVLSGSGADGSGGLVSVKEAGGLVIVQDPKEAGYDGMPRSAIGTGAADLVLPAADVPGAILRYDRRMALRQKQSGSTAQDKTPNWLQEIIDLLRTNSPHDFGLYKRGTLQRRIERRMAICALQMDDMGAYLEILKGNASELELLAKDLLINVTSFFRDPKVFEFLAEKIVPDLVRGHSADQPLRIWIAGCSTGEETYSLAMLFSEQIAVAQSMVKLQIFASDVDPDAVASAREGIYAAAIEADVSPSRLETFFTKDDHGYRVLPELRATIVFAVQDVLADPPFSRLDMVSCRNLLIYLRPEAQERVISLFHFALRESGVLLLGSAETAGAVDGRFELISKTARLYRHIGRARLGEVGFGTGEVGRVRPPAGPGRVPSRQTDLAELGKRLVLEAYAPAAILINRRLECLFSLGPTDRYLRVAPGLPTHDLLAMARPGLRTRLRSAEQGALREKARVVVTGGRGVHEGHALQFSVEVQPVTSAGEDLLLVCFVDTPPHEHSRTGRTTKATGSRVAELERELDVTRADLRGAVHDLELANEEQKAINEEALSVNEEYQSTNEELLTSKEELQSLNEELTALNSQLQETLERQRKTSDDLQNVLFSTDVATLFLDVELKIRFFTPATKLLFAVIPGDIGRPLADLHSLADDPSLHADARAVLQGATPIEREIEASEALWFRRRILPYRSHAGRVEGVVITFNDITRRKQVAQALDDARKRAELADMAKSRFLAAASHDLRQPLQTLALLHGLLAKVIDGDRAQQLVARLHDAVGAMSGMLNALLDINEIETGVVHAERAIFPINELLEPLRREFTYHAEAAGISLRMVPCSAMVDSDPRLLEQILRNLLSNALKYTKHGKVLFGCRRRGGTICVEIWDTGVGIDFGPVAGDLRRVSSDRQPGTGPRPWLWPRAVHRAAAGGPAGPCRRCPVLEGQRFRVLDRRDDGIRWRACARSQGRARRCHRARHARRLPCRRDSGGRKRSGGARSAGAIPARRGPSRRHRK